jgi:hypothetical protein
MQRRALVLPDLRQEKADPRGVPFRAVEQIEAAS